MTDILTLIAQDPQQGQPPPASPFGSMLFPLIMMGVVFYFLLIRPQSKEKKRRIEMIAAIKKNDRVVTIGGIVGTVISVKDDELTLKVDESSNTKITFSRSAIQRVTSGEVSDSTGDVKK